MQQSVALSPSQTPSVFRSPSLAHFFDRVLPQATNKGEINELIEQANRHHPTTLSSAEAPTGIQKKNISEEGGGGDGKSALSFPSPQPPSGTKRLLRKREFTAGISDKETSFLDTCVYKGERFERENILEVRTHFKPTEKFQYTHFNSTRSLERFTKGEVLRLLRTNSSAKTFEENIHNFKSRLSN